jgi:hypothetical protein
VQQGRKPVEFIDFTPASLQLGPWGLFHPAKQILREGHGLPFRDRAGRNDWGIGADDYAWLINWCRDHEVKRVWKFGPGDSTLAFLHAGCTVWSAEHDTPWRGLATYRFALDAGVTITAFRDDPSCAMAAPDWKPGTSPVRKITTSPSN